MLMNRGRGTMGNRRRTFGAGLAVAGLVWLCAAGVSQANNLIVTNLALVNNDPVAKTVDLQFDLSWSNSWRASWDEGETITNWDAAWVFFKIRPGGPGAAWYHANLSSTGHAAQAGINMDLGRTGGKNVGVLIYRSEAGFGSLVCTNVRVRWDFGSHGLVRATNGLDVSVHAVEMVYVPRGSFYVGDGSFTSIAGQFESGTNGLPFLVTNEAYEITLGGGGADSLGNNHAAGMATADDFNDTTSKVLPATFPKGFDAFYCMKYEITQAQYADFLNRLTSVQAPSYFPYVRSDWASALVPTNSWPNYQAPGPDRPADGLDATRVKAYLDWAGLRPMSEMEFEKLCRGPKTAVANEYPWGDIELAKLTAVSGVSGSGTETAIPTSANCNMDNYANGVRAGMFARPTSGRRLAGGGFYGAMELGGNVYEIVVSVGSVSSRAFAGTHGDGDITTVPTQWPSVGQRGGNYMENNTARVRTSDRYYVNNYYNHYIGQPFYSTFQHGDGGRGVRTAP